MAIAKNDEPTIRKPLRLWPGVVAAVLLLLVRFVVPIVAPDALIYAVLGGFLGGVAIVVWWLFFSRARWSERLGVIVLMFAALIASSRVIHVSIATGMMGMMFTFYAFPVLCLALVCWAVASHRLSVGPRRASLVAAILIGCGVWTLLRTGGISGNGGSDFQWRWSKTPEELLLAQTDDEPFTSARGSSSPLPSDPTVAEKAESTADWSGFRGLERDGIVRGVRIETDWSKSPPVELWRRAIGPGWSSFAVHGDLFYTQEQRGEEEIVACYDLTTGKPVWMHRDLARFWESNGGAGPRGTPTYSNGRVYTFGATGILNALNPSDGAVVWAQNAANDTGASLPGWGFSSSPLVVGDVVVVATSGALSAYDLATGVPRWSLPSRGESYSSPHLMTIDGTAQVLFMGGHGVTSVVPADGTQLWEHAWEGNPIVQPAQISGGDLLITTSGASGALGLRRIAISHSPGGWTVEERWTSTALKPYFNDFVIHNGHAFGFDGFILACIDLERGKRKWKGGRYGNGQLILLRDQDLLLVLSEEGELALVSAVPDQFRELARVPAIEGKTWNHPVLVGDILLVRNGQEMVAFQLSLQGR